MKHLVLLTLILVSTVGCKTLTPKQRRANEIFFCEIDTTTRWNDYRNRCEKIPKTVCKKDYNGGFTCTHH